MCGIVGVFPLNKTDLEIDPKLRRQLALFIHNEILFETVARGKDATGVSAAFGKSDSDDVDTADNFWVALKQPVDTADFFMNDGTSPRYDGQDPQANLEKFMDCSSLVKRPLLHIIGHTRAKTVGTEFNPLNNHPILVGKIIGIHNGGVKNYKKIYEKHSEMTPLGEVDSEVIMQLLAEVANDRAVTEEDIKYVTERIVGPRAVIAYNRDFPEKVLFFHDKDRPLELAYIEELGLAVICSERRFFNRAMHVYQRASLTLKRNLPQLTVTWRTVPTDKGGIIDVEEAFEGDWEVDELFPLMDCETTLEEYDDTYKHTPSTPYGSTNKHNSGHGNQPFQSIGKKNTTNTSVPEAEITDITKFPGYGPDTDSDSGAVKSIIASAAVMDGSPLEDEGDYNALDVYSQVELCRKGVEYVISLEGKEDESLLINRYDKSFSKYLSKPLSESDATEIVTQLYPEAFGEGYSRGFVDGVEDQIGLQSSELDIQATDRVEELEDEVKALQESLLDEKDNQRKAAAYIANMKAFLMAAILIKDLGRVEGEGSKMELIFDDDLEQFLGTARGFAKANPEMVKGIFNGRDLQTISTGMARLGKAVSGTASSSTAEVAALSKSIKN